MGTVETSVKRMLRTRGALVAAVTALAVGLTWVTGRLLIGVVSLLGPDSVIYSGSYVPVPLAGSGFMVTSLTSFLPFTFGYFVALWAIAPITEKLRIGHVLTRGILATGVGVTVWFIVLGLVGVIISLMSPHVFDPSSMVAVLIGAPLEFALQAVLTGFIALLPLGVLGGVLQWVWRTAHPADHHIEGLIDV